MVEIIFNIIESEIDHYSRHYTFDGWVNGKLDDGDSNVYLEYELHAAKPAIEWCQKQKMKFEVRGAEYAMRITFIFEDETDAMAFKLRWL